MIFTDCRVSYLNAHEPKANLSKKLKYSVCILIKKTEVKLYNETVAAIDKAKADGVKKGYFTTALFPDLKLPLRDGDKEFSMGKRGPEYKGCWFINASGDDKPGIVGPDNKPIFDKGELYSGCICHIDAGIYPFKQGGSIGIAAGFNNIMKVKDFDRLDGRMKAEDAFAGMETEALADGASPETPGDLE
jgi:hypothetical protein